MAKPSLYFCTMSPPARAVLMTAQLLDVDVNIVTTEFLAGDHLKPEYVKMNPQHTIPLLNDNGAIIYDSHAICAYLVEKYGKDDSLYPKDLVARAEVDARLHFDTGVLFARFRFLFEPIIYHGSTDLNVEKIEYISRAWPILEAFLANGKYLCGDRLTIADICCEATICSMARIVAIDAIRYPKLTAWRQLIAAKLPNYERDCRAGGVEFEDYIIGKCKVDENL